ncbi:unnamed protein product [Ilex paraguariensis]|uniref:F-box domain-containing protein n=1 Tax=Ilex paraguariensis TaxID=185542 RepID=A0ABC8UZF1_9AQUA
MFPLSVSDSEPTDGFDGLPDSLILLIFDQISDVKTLIRCRSVSKRFNSLVPQSDSLLLRVDRVISTTDSDSDDSLLITFLRSIFKSLHDFIYPYKPLPNVTRIQNSPTQILRGFDKIRELEIELPSSDLKLDKGAVIKWRAEFGKTLKSCVIMGFCEGPDRDGGLKMRVVWTISALIAASARHYMMLEVVREHKNLQKLTISDRESEGVVVMVKDGLEECRECGEEEVKVGESGVWWRNNRTVVPAVRMRLRHEGKLEVGDGVKMEGATLVVVKPVGKGGESEAEDLGLVRGAFGGRGEAEEYGEAVEKLLKRRGYLLEMNSF